MIDLTLCLDLCREFEGLYLKPYLCAAGVPTIGYGTTRYLNGKPVLLTDTPITAEEAEYLLKHQLYNKYLPGVLKICPNLVNHNAKLNSTTSFAYNLGLGNLQVSSFSRYIKQENWPLAADELDKWVFAKGKKLAGLVRRRATEKLLFNLE